MPNSKVCCQLLLDKLIQGNKPYRGSVVEEGQAGGGTVLWTRCFAYQSENQLELAWHAPLAQLFSLKLSASLSLSFCLPLSLSIGGPAPMGANFNLSVKTFTPRTQKCIITGVYVELALPNLSFLLPFLSPPACKTRLQFTFCKHQHN